ncbi:hypothetical protein AXG93_4542s1090 [Marchantia polymorpha subsp. ruderalis]|uniref:Uncharacterized protein n=1 Tax=Marchantia polymorpha subsp. ruderalis TaxID=1480154 RepID=A0A176W0I4_MARPO|nr:hypothetical protein AXG93_4542s1090 [Marchantia polymorpha subsp. ruderalis]
MNARDECLSVAGADDGGAVAGSARIDDGGVRLGFEATSGEEKSGRIRERPLVWTDEWPYSNIASVSTSSADLRNETLLVLTPPLQEYELGLL